MAKDYSKLKNLSEREVEEKYSKFLD